MFPRPEMMSSMRMIRQTPLERLHTMRESASNAQPSETLLQCLAVFQGPFKHSAAMFMQLDQMDHETCQEALRTLVYWGLVQRASQRRYVIHESLRRLYSPSPDLRARHLAYFLTELHIYKSNCSTTYWPDISLALVWALENAPDQALELCQHFAFNRGHRCLTDQWPLAFGLVEEIARQKNHLPLQAFVLSQRGLAAYQARDFLSADAWFARALDFYIPLDNRQEQGELYFLRGLIAEELKQIDMARDFLNRSSMLHAPSHLLFRSALWVLFQIEIDEENLEGAQSAMKRLMPATEPAWHLELLSMIAPLVVKNMQYAEARSLYTRAFLLAIETRQTASQINVLDAWAEMEFRLGDTQTCCTLYQLALTLTRRRVEADALVEPSLRARMARIAEIMCEET